MKRLFLASCGLIFLSGAIFLAAETAVASCDTSTVLGLCVTATPDPVRPGEQIFYSYTVANRGVVDLAGVVLSTLIPDHTSTSEFSITDGGDCVPVFGCIAGNAVRWSLGTLFAGQSRTVQMAARVDLGGGGTPADGTIIFNSASVTNSSGNIAVAGRSVVVDSTPVLSLSMVEDHEPVEPGGFLTYTLIFGNRGTVNAPGVTLNAAVPAGASFVSASDGGTVLNGVVRWSLGTVRFGGSGRRQFTVQVGAGATNGSLVSSEAQVADTNSPQNTARASESTAVRRIASSPLVLSLALFPDPVKRGEFITYSYTVTNRGGTNLAGVVLSTLIPDHTSTSEFSITDGGDCVPVGGCIAGNEVRWSLGTLFAGQSRTVQMAARVDLGGGGTPADGTIIFNSARVVDSNGNVAVAERSVVVDNTPALPTVRIVATDNTATEAGPTTGIFTVSRTGNTASSLTVFYTLGGTAVSGTDYTLTPAPSSVTIPAGALSAAITVTPLNDAVMEGNETVIATLSPRPNYTVGSPSSATVTFVSDERVTITATDSTATEAGPTTGTFRVSRTGSTGSALTVFYTLGGTAVSGTDYTLTPASLSVTIPAGSPSRTITVTPINDVVMEGNETVVVTLSPRPNYTVASPSSATATIISDERVTIIATDPTATEAGPTTGTFRVTRNGSTSSSLTVNYTVGGSATNGVDYQTLIGSVVIPAGSLSANIIVRPINDVIMEGNETVVVTLSPRPNYTVGSPNSATVTVVSNE